MAGVSQNMPEAALFYPIVSPKYATSMFINYTSSVVNYKHSASYIISYLQYRNVINNYIEQNVT